MGVFSFAVSIVQLNVIKVISDYYKGAIHLHGHQHNKNDYNLQQKQAKMQRYDVGVDANEFKPVSLEAIVKFFEEVPV